jgi:hypothetical protein
VTETLDLALFAALLLLAAMLGRCAGMALVMLTRRAVYRGRHRRQLKHLPVLALPASR